MHRYTIFFITVNALHVSGGFSADHQELKTVHTACGIFQACLLQAWQDSLSLSVLYMFQVVSPPIIRSSRTVHTACIFQACLQLPLHVSSGFSAHHQELKTVHTASDICQACLLLPLAWVSRNNSPTLAVDAVRTVLSSGWWAEKPPETCGALTVIKNTV